MRWPRRKGMGKGRKKEDAEIRVLIRRLKKGKPDVRAVTADELAARGAPAVEALLRAIRRERLMEVCLLWALIGMFCDTVFEDIYHRHLTDPLSLLAMLGFALMLFFSRNRWSDFCLRAAGVLARVEDIRATGPLIEARRETSGSREEYTAALMRLLPRVQPGDVTLTASESKALHWLLGSGDWDLAQKGFAALAQIGKREDLELLDHLLETMVVCEATEGRREAAAQCKEELRARLERERVSAILLRPAQAPGEDTLLRPAAGAGDGAVELLLRPSDGGKE